MTDRILQLNNEVLGNNAEKSIFYALSTGLVVVFFMYTYLVGSIIFGLVERKNTEISARELRSDIAVLEVEYLDLSGEITLEKAKELGFTEAKDQVFTERKAIAPSLSLRTNEI